MADLASRCGVAERTLNKHFNAFLGTSPMRYLRRLRLAAAREAFLENGSDVSVTEVARRFEFNHLGRFSAQYRVQFGEPPSATLKSRRTAAQVADIASLRTQLPLMSREPPSIAILPCTSATTDPGLGELAGSLAGAIAASLSSVRCLTVVTAASPVASQRDPRRLARAHNARYYLSGSILRFAAKLRLTVGVFETGTGVQLWGDLFDGDQPHALLDRVVAAVTGAVLPNIRGAEIRHALRAAPQSLDAHGLALRALPYLFAARPSATARALELLHQAMEFDPDYGLTTALAAWGHSQNVMYNVASDPFVDKSAALSLVQRAAVLDDDDPLVLTARGAVHTMAGEFDAAEGLIARALCRDPQLGWAWSRRGWLLSYLGHSDAAIKHFRRALALDRDVVSSANNIIGVGTAHFNVRRYETAIVSLRSAMRVQPGLEWANRTLAVSYARSGDGTRAMESLGALRRSCLDLTVGQVVTSVPFRADFLERLGNGLSDLGLPP